MSRVRRQLGYQGPIEEWSDARKIAVDSNYMAVDIVINWAADGIVLCFMHAVVDLTPRDNDENNKTCWTNWCGTPFMGVEQIDHLYQSLASQVPQTPSMNRVFQVLLNSQVRELWFSWPPDSSQAGEGPSPTDFAKLAEKIQLGGPTTGGPDAKTSCTRRYKSQQMMYVGGENRQEIESIFIPYGTFIPCRSKHYAHLF